MTAGHSRGSLHAAANWGRDAVPPTRQLALPVRRLLRLMHSAVIRRLQTAAQSRELAELSERQLRDAGIDLSLAGRGKAAAINMSVPRRLLSLGSG